MGVQVERVEIIGIEVADGAKVAERLSDLFDVNFRGFNLGDTIAVEPDELDDDDRPDLGMRTKIYIDEEGLFELLEVAKDESEQGFRNIHFKVKDLDVALSELASRGVHPIRVGLYGGMREAVMNPADFYGVRLCLVTYDGPSLISAMLDN